MFRAAHRSLSGGLSAHSDLATAGNLWAYKPEAANTV